MRKLYLFILAISFLSCDNSSSEETMENTEVESVEMTTPDTSESMPKKEMKIVEQDTLSDEELMAKWTWGEGSNIKSPQKSTITNFQYSEDLLLHKWKYKGDKEPILEFTVDSMDVYWDKYIYTINYDSLRIFTRADHPSGGVDRGLITKLTKDSLVIEWSTDDLNVYLTYDE